MESEKIYSELPINEAGHDYRIEKINEIQRYLEKERDKQRDLYKKYSRGVKWINNLDVILITTSMGLGVAGVGILSTIVLAPVVAMLEGIAIGAGLLCMVGKYATKKMSLKAQKHERIKILAEAKINSINDYVSKALNDGQISAEEFSFITKEFIKFQEMKHNITTKTRELIDEEIKNTLIEHERKEAMNSFNLLLKNNLR